MSRPRRFRGVTASLIVLAITGASGLRGYCPMTGSSAEGAGARDPHACCRTGLSDKAPSCCRADSIPSLAATLAASVALAPAVTTPHWNVFESAAALTATAVAVPDHSHSPPPLVLRV